MNISNIILNIVFICILNSCSLSSESVPQQVDELTLNQFIERYVNNWNWCYPDISDIEIREMFEGSFYSIKKEGYLPELRTNVYSVTTFCREGGSFLVLENLDGKKRSIIPATSWEGINMDNGEGGVCHGALQSMDRHKNGDMIGVESYLNSLNPNYENITEAELGLIFSSYLGRKYQTDRVQIEKAQVKNLQQLSKNKSETLINEFLECLFMEETKRENTFKKVLLFTGPGGKGIHIFIIKSSAEREFINLYPYRVDYFIL